MSWINEVFCCFHNFEKNSSTEVKILFFSKNLHTQGYNIEIKYDSVSNMFTLDVFKKNIGPRVFKKLFGERLYI